MDLCLLNHFTASGFLFVHPKTSALSKIKGSKQSNHFLESTEFFEIESDKKQLKYICLQILIFLFFFI